MDWICNNCNNTFSSRQKLREHRKTCLTSDNRWKCRCGETFKVRRDLYKHKETCKISLDYKMSRQKTWKCNQCGEVFSSRRKLQAHKKASNHPFVSKGIKLEPKRDCNCQYCERQFNYASAKASHEKYCVNNPNRLLHNNTKLSEESKEKIRQAQKKSWQSGNRKPWVRKSYAEQYFESIFQDAERNYFQIGYFLDFAWIDKMCYIEVDGEQHYYFADRIQHDIERTENLKNIGWTLIARIRWSEFVKFNQSERQEYINRLKVAIQTKSFVPDIKPTKSKKDIRNEKSILYKQNRLDFIEKRKNFILSQNDIDFTKFGWGTELSKRCGITSHALLRWIRTYMPDFYEKYSNPGKTS